MCNNTGVSFVEPQASKSNNFFTEIITSISDIKTSQDGQKIVVRDYTSVKYWDIRNPEKAVSSIVLYEPLKSKLCDYYENDCIFDKFSLGLSPDGTKVVSGLYD